MELFWYLFRLFIIIKNKIISFFLKFFIKL